MAEDSLAGGGVGVGVYEAAGGGAVITGLEVVEAGFVVVVVATTVGKIALYWRAIMLF